MKRILLHGAVLLFVGAATNFSHGASAPRFFVETKDNFLVGAFADGKWIDSFHAQKMVRGGENYAVFNGLRPLGQYKGGKAASYGGACAHTFLVKLQMPPYKPSGIIARRMGPPVYLGVSGATSSKNLLPRGVQALASSATYQNFVVQWLKSRGIKQPQVAISKIWRADLDGDGKTEIIINALRHNYLNGPPQKMVSDARAGDYSLLLVRRYKGKKLETIAIESQIYPQAKSLSLPTVQELTNILDLNGDGKLEIIVRGRYYQGGWTRVYEWQGGAPKAVLTAFCGI